jgi:hypothetical protein
MDPEKTADWLRMRLEDVQLALAYYSAYPQEIDVRLRRMKEIAENPPSLHPSVRVVTVSEGAGAAALRDRLLVVA